MFSTDEKMAIVIVNYKSCEFTINCIKSINAVNSKVTLKIFIIDNCSNNGDVKKLINFINSIKLKIELIESHLNDGFASGSNIGIQKALQEGYPYIMLLNNDTIILDDVFYFTVDFFNQRNDVYIVSHHILDKNSNKEIYSTRERPTFFDLAFIYHTPFWNKKWFPGYKKHFMLYEDNSKNFEIYAGSGAALTFRQEFFKSTGLLDESTFLFFEEFIIAEKALKNRMKTYYLANGSLIHIGGVSTRTFVPFSFIEYCRSESYFVREYLRFSRFKVAMLFLIRLCNYICKCFKNKDYMKNFFNFIFLKKFSYSVMPLNANETSISYYNQFDTPLNSQFEHSMSNNSIMRIYR